MAKVTGDSTNLRLKAVLDIVADASWRGEKMGGGAVLAEAIQRIPLNERESELMAGQVPRGHKSLTTATGKLVKAGWLVKSRAGWTITDDGLRATVAFPDADTLAAALAAGTPVPADMPVPSAPPETARKQAGAPKAAAGRAKRTTKAGKAAAGTAVAPESAAPEVGTVPAETAAPESAAPETPIAATPAEVPAETAPAEMTAPDVETHPQPDAVAIVGDFGTKLGAPADWDPGFDEVQMKWDPKDQLWKLTVDLPAGFYTYKVALNRSWDENYGAFGVRNGVNHEFHHGGGPVTFHYDHRSNDVAMV